MSRKMIAALQVSLDGFTQGSDRGGDEWVDSWADALGLLPEVDAFVQGAGMYPGYAEYWAAVDAAPHSVPPYQSRAPYEREVAYARLAKMTPHYVVSKSLDGVAWPPLATMVRDVSELRALKSQAGKNIYAVGGPTLVMSLLNADLLDELRLIVHPLLLGGGRALFERVSQRRSLSFIAAEPTASGKVVLSYRV
jgi:dihydrofolate reductase